MGVIGSTVYAPVGRVENALAGMTRVVTKPFMVMGMISTAGAVGVAAMVVVPTMAGAVTVTVVVGVCEESVTGVPETVKMFCVMSGEEEGAAPMVVVPTMAGTVTVVVNPWGVSVMGVPEMVYTSASEGEEDGNAPTIVVVVVAVPVPTGTGVPATLTTTDCASESAGSAKSDRPNRNIIFNL
jgi:hypothetical protein